MVVSNLANLSALLDEAKRFELVRQHRWPQGCALSWRRQCGSHPQWP